MCRTASAGRARFRRLGAADRAARLAHLARLGGEARRARFLGVAPAASAPEPALALGAWIGTRLRGVAELHPLPSRPDTAELAISVEPAFQGRGLGGALLGRLIVLARNRGIHRILTFCAEDNARLLALLRRAGARLRFEPGEARAELELLPASPATLALEALDHWETVALRLIALARSGAARATGCAAWRLPPPLPALSPWRSPPRAGRGRSRSPARAERAPPRSAPWRRRGPLRRP